MGRVVFLNAFAKDIFTGGIKTTYRHAALLNEEGIETVVLQPSGPPDLLKDPVQRALACKDVTLHAHDVAVYPETLNGWFKETVSLNWPCTKIIFCQNPFYFYSYNVTASDLKSWGIKSIIVPSKWAEQSIQSVIGFDDVKVVPAVVDTALFYPRPKKLQIVSASWKWNDHKYISSYETLIKNCLKLKYPHLAEVPWVNLSSYTENQVAELMGESAICLALGRSESLGLTALEAMASGCVTVGFHGEGGLDFATPQNGFWHSPEDIEGLVGSLALAIEGQARQLEVFKKIQDSAISTARRYNETLARRALKESYQDLLNRKRPLVTL
ncbi:glycosyltransferase [Aristophania vespae]|uniref:Glycosyltransferase n=1 Tax=Aristophania vespae TaxID=2697033 RepID=A0A6P1NKI5_9PROT|nr:glycosyltransferase [Aristophania vespae]QHI96162.1 glycosyltransferase [Aristophania vespae]